MECIFDKAPPVGVYLRKSDWISPATMGVLVYIETKGEWKLVIFKGKNLAGISYKGNNVIEYISLYVLSKNVNLKYCLAT